MKIQKSPFDGNDDPSLIDKDSQNVYGSSCRERKLLRLEVARDSIKDEYDTPSYEIVG